MEEVRNVPGSCIEGTEHSCRTPLVLLAFLTEVNKSHEGEERQSERNRSLEESRAIALRQKQNVGAVPD